MAEGGTRPMAGLRTWIITDGKIGMDVQCLGVADALGLAYEVKHVAPTGLWQFLAPWAPVNPAERFGAPGTPFAPPWPEVAIATGRLSIPYIRALERRARFATYTIVLQDPKTGLKTADLIWVPEHDRLRGVNVVTTLTAPHSFGVARLERLRAELPAEIRALPSPRLTVVLGGPSGAYVYDAAAVARLAQALRSAADAAGSVLLTVSRRTPAEVVAAAVEATAGRPRIAWTGSGPNPYPQFLAGADALVVTADSVNMTGEACATGRPVYVFHPSGGSAKFGRFHAALQAYGATRPLPEKLGRIDSWSYLPLDSAASIAAQVEQRWTRRQTLLPTAGRAS